MNHYKHIFFDLDRTLWDFEANSEEAIREIYFDIGLDKMINSFDSFINTYKRINLEQWALYRAGEITKDQLRVARFNNTLLEFGITNEEIAKKMDCVYVENSPYKKLLFPYALECLSYLTDKYHLHIITNGFKEVQYLKLKNCGLDKFFEEIFISEEVGSIKPEKEIFNHAVYKVNAIANECIMIGDDLEVDVLGARNVGIDQIFFNPENTPHNEKITYEIRSLWELTDIL